MILNQFPKKQGSVDPRVVIGSAILMIVLLIWMWLVPRGAFVLVVMQPLAPEQAVLSVIADAGGAYVGAGSLPWIAIAYSDAPSFPSRLRQAGAVLVLNANLTSICSQGSSS